MVERWPFKPPVSGSSPDALMAGEEGIEPPSLSLKHSILADELFPRISIFLFVLEYSQDGKASVFGTDMRRFDPFYSNFGKPSL